MIENSQLRRVAAAVHATEVVLFDVNSLIEPPALSLRCHIRGNVEQDRDERVKAAMVPAFEEMAMHAVAVARRDCMLRLRERKLRPLPPAYGCVHLIKNETGVSQVACFVVRTDDEEMVRRAMREIVERCHTGQPDPSGG